MFRTTVLLTIAVCTVLLICNGVYGFNPEEVTIRTEYMTDSEDHPYAKYTATHRNTVLWEFVTPGQPNSGLTGIDYFVIPDIVLIPVDSDLFALDLKTGIQRWRVQGTGIGISVVSDSNNNIYVTSFSQPDLSIISREGELLRRIESFNELLKRPVQIRTHGDYLKITYSFSDIQGLDDPKNQGIYPDLDYEEYGLNCIYVRIDELLAKPSVNNGILTPLSALSPLVKQNETKAKLSVYLREFLQWPVYFYKFDVNNLDTDKILEMMFTYNFNNEEFIEFVSESPLYEEYASLRRTTPEKFSAFCKKAFGIDTEFEKYKGSTHEIFTAEDGYVYDGTWYGGNGGYGIDTVQIKSIQPIGEEKHKTYYLEFEMYYCPETEDRSNYEAESVYDSVLLKPPYYYFDLPMDDWFFGGEERFTVIGKGSAIVRETQDGQFQLKYMNYAKDDKNNSFTMSPEDRLAYIQDMVPDKIQVLPSALPTPDLGSLTDFLDKLEDLDLNGKTDNFAASPSQRPKAEKNPPVDIPVVPITFATGSASLLSGLGLFIYNRMRYK